MARNKYLNKQELELFYSVGGIFNEAQMVIINQRTPPEEIEEKEENGVRYKTVKSSYVKKLVTIVTGGQYNSEIKNQTVIKGSEIKTESRLTILSNGREYFRDQCGSYKGHICADGYKASESDAFKKCASEFGFCWDIYSQEPEQIQEIKSTLTHEQQTKINRVKTAVETRCKTIEDLEFELDNLLEKESDEIVTKECSAIINNAIRMSLTD